MQKVDESSAACARYKVSSGSLSAPVAFELTCLPYKVMCQAVIPFDELNLRDIPRHSGRANSIRLEAFHSEVHVEAGKRARSPGEICQLIWNCVTIELLVEVDSAHIRVSTDSSCEKGV